MRNFRIELTDGTNTVVAAHDAYEAMQVFGFNSRSYWDAVTKVMTVTEVFPAEESVTFDAQKEYTAHCDSCANIDPFDGVELVKIQTSGYHGPYCTQCGVRYNKNRILEEGCASTTIFRS